jgi:excisionase family DNA binding protein
VSPRLKTPDAAAHLGITEWLLLELVRRGEIAHYKVGKRFEFDRADLDAWIAAQRVPAREPAAS